MSNITSQSIKGYELQEMIGAGSFGEVYRAFQPQVNREVAIKIILPHYANHPDFIRRFEAEAQLVARVEHPFIVPLYDYWRDPSGAYIVMRWFKGGSLKDLIGKKPMPQEVIARIMDQVSSALMAAHRNNVVHRDLKPANILMDDQGNAYLADFGIAKDIQQPGDATAQGSIVGSPAYLSPEQVRAEDVTPLSDIYCLGILLYEMLTGEKPFHDESLASLLIKQMNDPLPDPRIKNPHLPEAVNLVVQRTTAKNPKNRYPNALMVAAAFRKALAITAEDSVSLSAEVIRIRAGSEFDPTSDHTQEIGSSLDVELPEPENPYKGLRAFQESDASDFFGRSALVEELLARMQESHPLHRFLAVIGPSGSGKSSVVKAGVIPALRNGAIPGSEKWYIVEMVPGSHPFEELEAALLRIAVNPPDSLLAQLREDDNGLLRAIKRVLPTDAELFLLIDQFEEIFTLVPDEETRSHFLKSLIQAVNEAHSRLRVIVTLRADFYDKPLSYNAFGNAIRQRTEVVLPLSNEELEAAIVQPAERVGLRLEKGLPMEIIADVAQQPGALPLLQYALTELYERRDERLLTIDAYRDIGGISGALARRAEELFQSANANQQALIRQIFLRLVTLGEGTEDTRRRVHRRELLDIHRDPAAIQDVIDQFGKYRLLTFDHDPSSRAPTVEVAHEALLRRWERLKKWVDDMRDDLRQHERLLQAATEWRNAGDDSSYLATGSRLIQLEEWAADTDLALTQDEITFLNTSIAQREAREAAERERQAYEESLEERSRRFLRALVGVLAVGLIVAVILAVLALRARSTAEQNAEEARAQQELAEAARSDAERSAFIARAQQQTAEQNEHLARSLALVANARNAANEFDPNLGLTMALEATQLYAPPLPETERVLSAIAYGPGARYRLDGHEKSVVGMAVTPDGKFALSSSADATMILWNIQTGEEVRRFVGHEGPISDVKISPDGQYALSGSTDHTMILWDINTGEIVRRFVGHEDSVNAVAFSPDGRYALSGAGTFTVDSTDNTMRLWNVETGAEIRRYVHIGSVLSIAFSPDGQFAATTSGSAANLPGATDRRARLWNIATGQLVQRYEGFTGLPRSIAFNADGTQLAVGTWDSTNSGTIRIFDVQSGEELRRFFGHPNIVTRIAYMPDGEHIISASWDNSIRIWDIATGITTQRFDGNGDRVLALAVTPDGQYAVTGTGNIGDVYEVDNALDHSVWVWDLQTRAEVARFQGHTDWVWAVVYSPDGKTFASSSGNLFNPGGDDSIQIWDTTTHEQLHVMQGHTHTVDQLLYTADGSQLLSGSWDGSVRLWDVASGTEIRQYAPYEGSVYALAFNGDESAIVIGYGDGVLLEVNTATGEEIRRFTGIEKRINWVTFNPQGDMFATADENNLITLWDYASGEVIRTLEGHSGGVTRVDFSADGTQLLSAAKDSTARLWDVATGTEIRRFEGHSGWINDAEISPDGQQVMTAGADTTVRIWDIDSGDEVRHFEGHTDWVVSADFSPDGSYVLSGSDDLTVRQWQVARSVAELRDWALANRYIPELSCEQRAQLQLSTSTCQ